MKIKERLRLNTWIFLGVIVLTIFTLAWLFREIYRTNRNELLIDEIRKVAYERTFLRDDYLLNRSEPAKIQWHAQSETLRALLESASEMFTGTVDRALLQKARKNFDITFSSFSAISEKEKQKEPDDRKKLAFSEAELTLISQVFLNAHALNDSIVRLHESSRGASITARDRGIIFIIIFVVGGIIAIVINSIFISGIVAKRLTALHEGVEIIGGGNLDYRIDDVGDDELSDLARASNEMVAKQKASQEYAESIINTVREPLIALNQDLRVVTVSRSFYEFFKVTPDETVGQLIYDLGNKQWDIPKLRELLETILPQKATFDDYEVKHDFTTIGRRIMLLNARQIQRRLGKERIILLAIEDVTERKEIEEGLEKTRKELETIKISEDEAREYAESIINTVREPLIALNQDLRVITASRSFYEFFKVTPNETVGQLIYDLGNKQWDIPKLRELLETILPQKATFDDYEVEHDFTTIGRRIMLLNARQIQRRFGKERIILLAIEDVTERKEIENGLKKAHDDLKELATELKRTTRVKSEFLANMSHELRTPLNAIIGFSEVLEDGLYGDLNDRQKTYAQHIFNAGTHLLSLINDILDLSKVEAGKMELEASHFSLRSVLNSSVVMLKEKAVKHGIDLCIEVEPDADIHIEADERKIKQIVFNLLSNAVKFTPDGGRVTVRARLTVVEGEQRRMIEVSIEDTGIGIKEEDLPKLFGEFTQLHQSVYSKEYAGTGLGLALTKHLVELHHGNMWVKSEFGKGSRFYFSLPV